MPSVFESLKALRIQGDNPNLPVPERWNTDHPLFKYQRVGASHLLGFKRFVLGDPTGWGILQEHRAATLVVVTTTSAVDQWESEIRKFLPGSLVFKAVGTPPEREYLYGVLDHVKEDVRPVLILSWGIMLKDGEKLLHYFKNNSERTWIVLDEIQRCRNPKAQIYKLMEQVVKEVPRVHGLTATLVKNKAHDAFHILNLLVPGVLSQREFERNYCTFYKKRVPMRTGKGGGTRFIHVKELKSYHHLDHFSKLYENFYLSRKDSEMDLDRPELQLITRSTDMTPTHRKIYTQVEKGFFVENVEADNNAAQYALSQSQIAVNSPEHFDPDGVLFTDVYSVEHQTGYDKIIKESSKLTLLKDLLENELEDEPVIIYSSFATTIESLYKHLAKYKPVMIHGQTQRPGRELARAKFQEGKTNLILITDAGGEALNLQRAGHVIFYSLPWTPGAYVQIIGRARRFGSERKFLGVWHLTVKDSVDELVSASLNSKVSGFETILKTPDQVPVSTDSLPLEVARAMRQRRIKF